MTLISEDRPRGKGIGRDLTIDQTIGCRIRMLRVKRGLTQKALGVKLGISFQQVQKYENGKNSLSASRFVPLALALDVPPTALLGGDDEGPTPLMMSVQSTRMAIKFDQLDSISRQALSDLLDAMLRRDQYE